MNEELYHLRLIRFIKDYYLYLKNGMVDNQVITKEKIRFILGKMNDSRTVDEVLGLEALKQPVNNMKALKIVPDITESYQKDESWQCVQCLNWFPTSAKRRGANLDKCSRKCCIDANNSKRKKVA